MTPTNKYGTGRIADIISYLKTTFSVSSIRQLPPKEKLDILCEVLQLKPEVLDDLIVENSPVLRTLQGHTFEIAFEYLVESSGYKFTPAGGDTNIDAIVNGKTLQLKTPYKNGTRGNIVSYKSHKTHGAKSEGESIEYYSSVELFPNFLVGLISYTPLRVVFLDRSELPVHPNDKTRILSPFLIQWDVHPGLNAFERIGISQINPSAISELTPGSDKELLPRTAKVLQLKTDFILNTILLETNFRIWDMNIRGFAREVYLTGLLNPHRIAKFKTTKIRPLRGDKADLALQRVIDGTYVFFQMKGVSINYCKFKGAQSVVGVETQLTRGRVNDHETRSRLYKETDFDYLMVGLDPVVAQRYNIEIGKETNLDWEVYIIPTSKLARHHDFSHRIKSVQVFNYIDLQQYRLPLSWLDEWAKENLLL